MDVPQPPALDIERVARRYSILASAVSSQKVGVVPSDGSRSYTDGTTIFAAGSTDALLRATVVVQAALLAVGSFDSGAVARLAGRPARRERYLTLEAVRALHVLRHAVPGRVFADVVAVYPGDVSRSREESLRRAASPREDIPAAPDWFGTIRPVTLIKAGLSAGGSPSESDRATARPDFELRADDDNEESERSVLMELMAAPIDSRLGRVAARFLGAGRGLSASGGGDEMAVSGRSMGRVGRNAASVKGPTALQLFSSGVPVGRRYPEWDWVTRGYRSNWCAVAEFDPAPADQVADLDLGTDRRLRRELSRLGLAHARHRRQPEGDALDITALIESVVDRRAGAPGDPRVYETKRRTDHDLGVLVLLDATGSTAESSEGLQVFEEQRRVTAALVAAFDELGDRVAAHGFCSQGRDSVRYLRIKDFDDRYNHAAQRRLASLSPSGFTRLGAAIRHGTHLLTTAAGTSNLLLIVIGDGLPYDDGYEHAYAQHDSRRALSEAIAQGVGCACISASTSTPPEIIDKVWGHASYRTLDGASELSRHAYPLIRDALRSASASRRQPGAG